MTTTKAISKAEIIKLLDLNFIPIFVSIGNDDKIYFSEKELIEEGNTIEWKY